MDNGLCKRIGDLGPIKPRWVAKSRDIVTDTWQDDGDFRELGLEQAVIRQLGHLEFIDAIHPRRRAGSIDAYTWLSHITHLMCFALRHAKENSANVYERFAKKLELLGTRSKALDRIVTFNYDDLLDRKLLAAYAPADVYFDRIKESAEAPERRDGVHPYPFLVKLHGSVNWRCREQDFEKIIRGAPDPTDPVWLSPVWLAKTGTPEPADSVYPLMVPPLPVKPITSISLFRYLWTLAYEYLHEAEHIVVIGYSLPDADRMAWSLFGNFRNQRLKTVTVVDPNPAVLTKWRTLFARRSVAVARWEYFDDFDDYVRRLT
ncbi:MAG: hypothetical protein JNM50_05250 [Chromatiales bacterium]|nr:hypothetical protein [Chromatiales bacterium]